MKRDWTLYQPSANDPHFQLIPNNDNRIHKKYGADCWCEPRVAFENGKKIVIHDAKDLRK